MVKRIERSVDEGEQRSVNFEIGVAEGIKLNWTPERVVERIVGCRVVCSSGEGGHGVVGRRGLVMKMGSTKLGGARVGGEGYERGSRGTERVKAWVSIIL